MDKEGKTFNRHDSEWRIFYIVSIIFAVIMAFAAMAGDDISSMHVEQGTIPAYWRHSMEMYYGWTSRLLINFVMFFFTDHSPILWAGYMGLCLLVLMSALSLLFVDERQRKQGNHFIAGLVMLLPFSILCETGWISTTTTYLAPTAFGMMSLVPIRKILDGTPFRRWEFIAYAICLIYGANNEQMMAVLLAGYTFAVIWLAFQRRICPFLIVLWALCAASAVFIMTCPGNYSRMQTEINLWFPIYPMTNMIDRADMGYTEAVQWLLFGGHSFIIFLCALFAALIWKRYQEKLFRAISLVPIVTTLLTGPLNGIALKLFPSLEPVNNERLLMGLVTAENRGSFRVFILYLVMGAAITALFIEILLLIDDMVSFAAAALIVLSGAASKVIIGFSPTVYASGNRTCMVMSCCILAAAVLVYSLNIQRQEISPRFQEQILYLMDILMAVSFINLAFLAGTAFR